MITELHEPLSGIEAVSGEARYAVLDQGAHVLAWQPAGERPVLWTSARSHYEPGVAIRGGIPVVFPWFGSGPDGTRSPAHGYARISLWERESVVEDGDRLTVRHALRAPGPLSAQLQTSFAQGSLTLSLTVTNRGADEVGYEAALHTYLAVGDIRQAGVTGLEGCGYRDTVPGRDPGPQVQAGSISFTEETDRLYRHEGDAVLHDPAWGRSITVSKQGSASTVVWNPWIAKAAAMPDFGDDEWPAMVCIEAGNLRDAAVRLAAGDSHTLTQSLALA